MMRPRCRFCGVRVTYFGDLCVECDAALPHDEFGDPIMPPSEWQIADAEGIQLREEVDY